MYSIDKITFEGEYPDGRTHYQDVLHDGKCVAAIGHRQSGLLKPVEIWCQKLVPDTEIPKLKDHYISEDPGYVFAVFKEMNDDLGLTALIEYLNRKD
jgi:hypothetical protein